MYAAERQDAISALVRQQGRVSVADVAQRFGVTHETVRRDLDRLEGMGLVHRVHGGAVAYGALTVVESSTAERSGTRTEQKRRIGAAAVDLLPDANGAGSILVDGGTTTGALAAALPVNRELTVVTNSVPTASLLAGRGALRVNILGGRIRGHTHATVGHEAMNTLNQLTVDVAFIGTNGLSARGATTPDTEEAAVKRAMAAAARTTVVLADSTKMGETQMIVFAALADIDVVVTDDGVAAADVQLLRRHDIEVMLA